MNAIHTTICAGLLLASLAGGAPLRAGEFERESAQRINQANELLRGGNVDGAIGAYEKAREFAPESADLSYNMAVAKYRKGDVAAAEPLFQAAAASENDSLAARSRYNLGNCDYSTGLQLAEKDRPAAIEKLESAIANYRSSLAVDSSDADARANIELANQLIEKLKEEQKQQEQQQQNQQQQDQQQQSDDQQQKGQQGQQDNKQQQDQKQKDQRQKQDDEQQQDQQQKEQQQKNDQQQQSDSSPGDKGQDEKSKQDQQSEQDKSQQEKQDQSKDEQDKQSKQDEQPKQDESQQNQSQSESQSQQDSDKESQQQPQTSQKHQQQPKKSPQQNSPTPGDEPSDKQGKSAPQGELSAASEKEAQDAGEKKQQVAAFDPSKDGEMTQQEAEKMLQAIRDRDMLRRLQQQRNERNQYVPVDRDW